MSITFHEMTEDKVLLGVIMRLIPALPALMNDVAKSWSEAASPHSGDTSP